VARQGTFIKNERAQDLDVMQRHEGLAALGERVRPTACRRAPRAGHAGRSACPDHAALQCETVEVADAGLLRRSRRRTRRCTSAGMR